MTPDYDVAQKLAGASIGLTYNTNLFDGPIRPAVGVVPVRAVFCFEMPGGEPENYCNNGASTPQLYFPSVRVLIRSTPQSYSDGRSLGRSIIGELHDKPPTGYISCRARQSQPALYGGDDNGSQLFGVDFDLMKDE